MRGSWVDDNLLGRGVAWTNGPSRHGGGSAPLAILTEGPQEFPISPADAGEDC